MEKISHALIIKDSSIRQAMKQLNDNSMQILLVVDSKNMLIGTLTDGDIRRALLKNLNLDTSVAQIMNKKPKFLYVHQKHMAKQFMIEHSVIQVPVLNKKGQIEDLILWSEVSEQGDLKKYPAKENIVFLLAGGKGTRLDPFTKILPKPLIPIGNKPILEVIMENFKKYGFNNFVVSLNYKAEMIKIYFKESQSLFNIEYVQEKEFLGTAGSLCLIKDQAHSPVIVSNCDVILEVNFHNMLQFHRKNKNDITIVGVVRHTKIPYGVIEMNNGALLDIKEKPELDFIVNAGIYIIEPSVISLIQENEYIDMPVLILNAKGKGCKVGVYPESANFIDIGQWEEYKNAIDHFKSVGVL